MNDLVASAGGSMDDIPRTEDFVDGNTPTGRVEITEEDEAVEEVVHHEDQVKEFTTTENRSHVLSHGANCCSLYNFCISIAAKLQCPRNINIF